MGNGDKMAIIELSINVGIKFKLGPLFYDLTQRTIVS